MANYELLVDADATRNIARFKLSNADTAQHLAAQGVFTLFAILFIFIGAQFIGLGLLGEYIGRIYHDVRARPRYFIQEIITDTEDRKQQEPVSTSSAAPATE